MPHNAVNQVVKAAVGEVARAAHLYDVQRIGREFAQTIEREPGIALLMLSTADGRAITEQSSLDVDGRRLAAMANSFLTLGETLARESGLSEAGYATISTRGGQLVLIRIRADKPLTLTAVGSADLNAAALLFNARDCAGRLATALAPPAG
ncbi:roadblock/LC7 domain-containing protein [Xanthomonas cassavae CFBP 4642]|uniref:Roadblock/LC7 domain-containing protein n=1 Tax=Xanthomonas cassavae CFBP 4642 TaxID=1219375 RepID=A0ABS8HI53_9XANT|nr:roadblock/LC7 domain-containing protein [Xanthomonas cassavae]MCC4621312.1 roadblock/LC7 domain-containing protein [Xanthomonas cassavae CFBP 4642]